MIHPLKIVWLLMVLALLIPLQPLFATPTAPVSDIRVLIDVSGSMKKNDPNNLRAPALRLIVGLLPSDSIAGTWTFGKYVNMLVPLREVNDTWKLEAELQSKNIHSYGLFTNIEQALNKATANQKGIDPRYRRSVILLSDGLVDVSKDDKINEKSRQRILDNIVPRLKKNNVAVHTIALSNSADHNLLRAISLATDGWYEQVDNADQLQRVFLHLFEKAATRDTVPLVENQFKIDNSVSEMTLLIFRREGSKSTELLLPNQSRVSLKNMPNNVRWHSEGNYDLITIDKPLVGQWQIDADIDPDNRVMIVTDLKLKTTDLPNNILIGETFDFDVSLTDKNKLIVRQDFLKLVDAKLKEESANADPVHRSLNEEQKKGIYRTHVGENFQAGQNDLVITMTSATFERQRRQSINVVETPFEMTVEQLTDKVTRTHRLTLKPDVDLIKTDKLSIAAMLTAQDGSEWSYDVMKVADNEWQLTLADLQ
ncbi:MAG: VWA domain-containing protein, partial [Pseudomonadota bacterium]|nr:VWA domain-containing protein [Pseudomonadota bacterium]